MAKTNEKALDAYMTAVDEIRSQLSALSDLANDHFGHAPEKINWGHVGSAQHISELLREVMEFAG